METDYSWCYLKKSWLFRFSAPFLNGNFFPCPLGHKLFSSWKHSCLTETLHKKINNKKTQRNQGSCDKTAWCFFFIQLGTSFGLHLLSAKRPGCPMQITKPSTVLGLKILRHSQWGRWAWLGRLVRYQVAQLHSHTAGLPVQAEAGMGLSTEAWVPNAQSSCTMTEAQLKSHLHT